MIFQDTPKESNQVIISFQVSAAACPLKPATALSAA
jgi:hypothetical protein